MHSAVVAVACMVLCLEELEPSAIALETDKADMVWMADEEERDREETMEVLVVHLLRHLKERRSILALVDYTLTQIWTVHQPEVEERI